MISKVLNEMTLQAQAKMLSFRSSWDNQALINLRRQLMSFETNII